MSTLSDAFSNIANSIRSKLNTQDTFTPLQMADAINNISSGPSVDLSRTCIVNDSVNGDYAGSGSCAYMFINCYDFNQPVNIGDNVTNTSSMFYGCNIFNQPINIPNNVTNTSSMFSHCYNFNQPINIPDNVTNTAFMFNGCWHFNKQIIIPNNVTNTAYMFNNCYYFNRNIYIKSTEITNIAGMLRGHDSQKRINLFCTNLASLNHITATTSLIGSMITWNNSINGYYNRNYNIYLYNNLPEDI